jgi:hypothetical protein
MEEDTLRVLRRLCECAEMEKEAAAGRRPVQPIYYFGFQHTDVSKYNAAKSAWEMSESGASIQV